MKRGGLYKTDGNALWKFWIRPLKETNLGVAQAFCDPQKKPKYIYNLFFSILLCAWDLN